MKRTTNDLRKAEPGDDSIDRSPASRETHPWTDHRPWLSGQRRGIVAAFVRTLLWIASQGYGVAIRIRNRRYDRRPQVAVRCGVPVISVGNLTTGGTGKTPVVRFLARRLRDRGIRVSIVSRGYGGGEAGINDEALELEACLPDVPHVQDPDRVAAARVAVDELDTELILMDDGFQHRRLHRDLDVLIVDASCPFGFGYLLPRGLLREPLGSLRRADLVIVSRARAVDDESLRQLRTGLRRIAPGVPIVTSEHAPAGLLKHPGEREPLRSLDGASVALVSAIGNPDAFERTVRGCGANVVARRDLPDHDPYSPETVRALDGWLRTSATAASMAVCTHKDLVKLRTDRLGGLPLRALQIELEILSDEACLTSWIGRAGDLLNASPSRQRENREGGAGGGVA